MRINELEISSEDMWMECDWYDGMSHCESLGNGYRMPTREERKVICRDAAFRNLITEKYSTVRVFSSADFPSHGVWVQRPDGSYRRGDDGLVVPVRDAKTQKNGDVSNRSNITQPQGQLVSQWNGGVNDEK